MIAATIPNIALFLLHRFFSGMALTILFAFGALMIYGKVGQSIPDTLLFFAANYGVILVCNTILWRRFVRVLTMWGTPRRTMIAGLAMVAATQAGIAFLPSTFIGLLLLAATNGIGSNLYYLLSDTIRYSLIGSADRATGMAALFHAVRILAALVPGVIVLNVPAAVAEAWLFGLAAIAMLAAAVTLVLLPVASHWPSWSRSRLTPAEWWGGAELAHEVRNTAVPLALAGAFGMTAASGIGAWMALASIVAVLLGASCMDGRFSARRIFGDKQHGRVRSCMRPRKVRRI
ncbi:MAG: hypothetical protein WCF85_15560 [Rhodospirillaceae bacterium]